MLIDGVGAYRGGARKSHSSCARVRGTIDQARFFFKVERESVIGNTRFPLEKRMAYLSLTGDFFGACEGADRDGRKVGEEEGDWGERRFIFCP